MVHHQQKGHNKKFVECFDFIWVFFSCLQEWQGLGVRGSVKFIWEFSRISKFLLTLSPLLHPNQLVKIKLVWKWLSGLSEGQTVHQNSPSLNVFFLNVFFLIFFFSNFFFFSSDWQNKVKETVFVNEMLWQFVLFHAWKTVHCFFGKKKCFWMMLAVLKRCWRNYLLLLFFRCSTSQIHLRNKAPDLSLWSLSLSHFFQVR